MTDMPLPIDSPNPAVDPNALSMGVFTGFKMRQPEYAVVTPQNLDEFTVRSLTVAEEQALKGTMTTPRKIPEHLNSILWDCIVKRPERIKTFDDFKRYVTVDDRDALLYGLYHITYKDVNNYPLVCPVESCQNKHEISLKISDTFTFTGYTGQKNEIMSLRSSVELEDVEPKATFILKAPTIADEEMILNHMLFQSNEKVALGMELTIIDKLKILHPHCEAENPDDSDYIVMGDLDPIYNAYRTLPPVAKKKILKEYQDKIGKYCIKLAFNAVCPKCSHEQEFNIQLGEQFFRAMYE